MGNVSSISKGIDVNAIVSSLMEVEKLPLGRLNNTRAQYDAQLTNYDKFNSLLTNFSKNISNLKNALTNNAYKINSSDNNVLSTVQTTNTVSPSQYNINISQLAQAQQLASAAFSSNNSALNISGNLVIDIGEQHFSLTLSAENTLETIRDKINHALTNPGVSATILSTTSETGTPEYRLILTAKETGLANHMQLSGDALPVLDLTHEITAAQDAIFTVDGYKATRSTNTISDLLEGITFTLNAANSSALIQITADNVSKTDNVSNAIRALVDGYNALIDNIDKNQSTKNIRDNTYSIVKLRLQNTLSLKTGTGDIQNLFDMGLQTAPSRTSTNDYGVEYVSTGKLTLDNEALSQALNTNLKQVTAFFMDVGSGFINAFESTLNDITKQGGNITNREQSIKEQETRINQKIGKEESRLEFIRAKLIKQYSSLDIFIQHYQQLSGFLEQQLASLNNNKK